MTAYTTVGARAGGAPLAGVTVRPGLHTITGAASNTTTLTLERR